MSGILVSLLAVYGALFDVAVVPLEHPEALCFFAAADADSVADLFVLDGRTLTVYPNAGETPSCSLVLPEAASAVDVADLDGDGRGEVAAIAGTRVLRYNLAEESAEPVLLFEAETQLAGNSGKPFLHVLALQWENETVLGLPAENQYELRRLDGELIQAFPIGADAPHHVNFGQPFSCGSLDPPVAAPADGIEMSVSRVIALKPRLPKALLPVEAPAPVLDRGTVRQVRSIPGAGPATWPWFPLNPAGEGRDRVRYAAKGGDTVIRLQRFGGEEPPEADELTAPHVYPGRPLVQEAPFPDFNADGFTDLVLWKSPQPAPTLESLTRAAMRGTWPVHVSVHLYGPEKGRFQARPAARVTLEPPATWMLMGISVPPLRHVVLDDFNGDGRTDFACSSAPRSFSVWCFDDTGFSPGPDFEHTFLEPLREIVVQAALDERQRTGLVLRGENTLFVLRPEGVPEAPGN